MPPHQTDVSTIKARLSRNTRGFDKGSSAGTTEEISYRPDPSDFPIPELIFIALRLLGFAWLGPEEKCRWTVEFSYLERPAAVSLKKFGFTITIDRTLTSSETKRLEGQLRKAAQTVEKWLEPQAEAEILEGNFLIANRYAEFDARYRFFREPAEASFSKSRKSPRRSKRSRAAASREGQSSAESLPFSIAGDLNHLMRHRQIGFFNSTAMVDAYFSRLEHQTILLIAFMPSPSTEPVSLRMSKKWDEKLKDVFEVETDKSFKALYMELRSLKQRIRNPFAHGGVENDMGWMQISIPGIGAIPANFSQIRHSARFQTSPIDENAYVTICALFDSLDKEITESMARHAQMLIEAGVDPACDEESRHSYAVAMQSDAALGKFIDRWGNEWTKHRNMDY